MSDYAELAAHILGLDGLDPYESTDDYEQIEEALVDNYDLSIDKFEELVDKLLLCTMPTASPFTGERVHLFGRRDPKNPEVWIAFVRKIIRDKDNTPSPSGGG